MEAKTCGCPIIHDNEWHKRTFSWEGRTFFRKDVSFFLGTPMGIEDKTREAAEEIEKRGYALDEPSIILVQPGSFKGAVLIGIFPPGEDSPDIVTFDSRPLVSVVHRSSEPKVAKGLRALRNFVKAQHRKVKEIYIWYTTCPTCFQDDKKYTSVLIARTS